MTMPSRRLARNDHWTDRSCCLHLSKSPRIKLPIELETVLTCVISRSYIPNRSATVPPETPGIMSATPIQKPRTIWIRGLRRTSWTVPRDHRAALGSTAHCYSISDRRSFTFHAFCSERRESSELRSRGDASVSPLLIKDYQ